MNNLLSLRKGLIAVAVAGISTLFVIALNNAAKASDDDDIVTETRDLADFTKIEIKGGLELDIKAGESQSVKVTTASGLMDDVEMKVSSGTLVIDADDKRRSRWKDADVEVTITMAKLEALEVMGGVDADISGIDSDSLLIDIKGAADIDISGTCGTLTIDVKGAGDIDAEDLKCKDVEIDIKGAGDAEVYASESVNAGISGIGSIKVSGNPKTVRKRGGGIGSIEIE